jgi:hypothetical protein
MRIPRFVSRASTAFGDWANVPIWTLGRHEIRRIDVMIVLGGILCASYYYWTGGWLFALQGLALYIFIVMVAMWII